MDIKTTKRSEIKMVEWETLKRVIEKRMEELHWEDKYHEEDALHWVIKQMKKIENISKKI